MNDQPDATHPQYDEFLPIWTKCRDAEIGERAIQKAGETYLPKLKGQTAEDYKSYVARAQFYNATCRTVESLRGLVFVSDPTIELPKAAEDWKTDITLTGVSLDGLARSVVKNTLITGRHGLLVEYPAADGTIKTLSEATQLDLRPYLVEYDAEDILNWSSSRVNNAWKLSFVALREVSKDGEPQVRHLQLVAGQYLQAIYIQLKNKSWTLSEIIIPTKAGTPLDFIPFFFESTEENTGDVVAPPIEDLVNINIGHYRNSADYENGLHVVGQPTPFLTGVDRPREGEPEFEFSIGSNTVLLLSNPESTAGFLQCGAEGFASLREAMQDKVEQMAAMGARILAAQKKQTEAAQTAAINKNGESSVLSDWASAMENPLEKALKVMVWWEGLSGDVKFELNKDYLVSSMTAQEITAHMGLWQSGAMSHRSLFDALKAGKVYPETMTFEDEQEFILQDPPALGGTDDQRQPANT